MNARSHSPRSARCSCSGFDQISPSGLVLRTRTCPVCCSLALESLERDFYSQYDLFEPSHLRSKGEGLSVSAVLSNEVVTKRNASLDPDKDLLPF